MSYFYIKIKIMKTKILKNKFNLFRYLLFLPLLLLSYCQVSNESIEIDTAEDQVITKDSKIVSLIKSAMKSDDDNDDDNDDDDDVQCVPFQYPFAIDAIFANSQSIETIIINNDAELFAFFDTLTSTDQIRFDFPITLIGADGNTTSVGSVTELEAALQIVVDACRDDDDDDDDDDEYPYCNDNKTKVYICHNGHTICVSVNAMQAHLDHGDSLGECKD